MSKNKIWAFREQQSSLHSGSSVCCTYEKKGKEWNLYIKGKNIVPFEVYRVFLKKRPRLRFVHQPQIKLSSFLKLKGILQ